MLFTPNSCPTYVIQLLKNQTTFASFSVAGVKMSDPEHLLCCYGSSNITLQDDFFSWATIMQMMHRFLGVLSSQTVLKKKKIYIHTIAALNGGNLLREACPGPLSFVLSPESLPPSW